MTSVQDMLLNEL